MDRPSFKAVNSQDAAMLACELCGALVVDEMEYGVNSWVRSKANQELHAAWHERQAKEIQMSALGFPSGLF